MQYIDLTQPSASTGVQVSLAEITGGNNSVSTTCRLRHTPGKLFLSIHAQDPDPLGLIASEPLPDKPDSFLYEEDCVHIAIALPGQPQPLDYSLINPRGARKGSKAAADWQVHASRSDSGWVIDITIPIPDNLNALGLLAIRFYRGVHGELHGLSQALPHPMDVTTFTPVLLSTSKPAEQAAADFTQAAFLANSQALEKTLETVRARITKNLAIPDRPWLSLDLARQQAQTLLKTPVPTTVRALSWTEQYLLNGLIDLWELDADPQWIQSAIARSEQVWASRAHLQNRPDTLWHQVMPTWYDAEGADHTPITLGTGVIIYPMARLTYLIHTRSELAQFKPLVSHWQANFQNTIAVHDRDWIDLPRGEGNYLEPYCKGPRRLYPSGGSRICPLNRSFYLALPMFYLAKTWDNPLYMDRVRKMARYFKASCQRLDNGSLVWEYLTSRYPAAGEDVSHASSQVTFARMLQEAGIEFTTADLQAMALTLKHNILRYNDVPCECIRAVDPRFAWYLGLWSQLSRFAPETLPKIIDLVEAAYAEGHPHTRQTWGLRNVTAILLARR